MFPDVAYRNSTTGTGGDTPQSLPSIISKFRQGNDVGFLRVAEEASQNLPLSSLSFSSSEPFLYSNTESRSLRRGTSWDLVRETREPGTFDWSRNFSSLRREKYAGERESARQRQETSSAAERMAGRRWKGDGIVTSTLADTVTGKVPFSELVVELSSRDSSPHVRPTTVRCPSVISIHGRPASVKRRSRRGSFSKSKGPKSPSKFPNIIGEESESYRVPPLPKSHSVALRKLSHFRSAEISLHEEFQRLQEEARHPLHRGQLSTDDSFSGTSSPERLSQEGKNDYDEFKNFDFEVSPTNESDSSFPSPGEEEAGSAGANNSGKSRSEMFIYEFIFIPIIKGYMPIYANKVPTQVCALCMWFCENCFVRIFSPKTNIKPCVNKETACKFTFGTESTYTYTYTFSATR